MKDYATIIIVWIDDLDYSTACDMIDLLEKNHGYYSQGYLSGGGQCCGRKTQDGYEIEAYCVDNDKVEGFVDLLNELRLVYELRYSNSFFNYRYNPKFLPPKHSYWVVFSFLNVYLK